MVINLSDENPTAKVKTTISVFKEDAERLDKFKIHPREVAADTFNRLLNKQEQMQ